MCKRVVNVCICILYKKGFCGSRIDKYKENFGIWHTLQYIDTARKKEKLIMTYRIGFTNMLGIVKHYRSNVEHWNTKYEPD